MRGALSRPTRQRLRHKLPERRRRGEPILLAQQMRLGLGKNNLQRCVIERQVMTQQQQQPTVVLPIKSDECPLQWRFTNIQSIAPWIKTFS